MTTVELTIDGKWVVVERGSTVLDAARSAGVSIPTLCAHETVPSYGACRMCIVEIEGLRGLPTACTTPVEEGMVVRTQTPEIRRLRRLLLELVLSGHPNACLVCDHREACETYRPEATKAGRTTRCGFCSNRSDCSIRNMTIASETRELDLPVQYAHHNVERSDPFMIRDHNLCILCGRCWRICEQIHGSPAISIVNRGRWARIGAAFGRSYVDSGCTFCGACIDICPTGTLTDRYARWQCKLEDGPVSTCTICPEGCQVRLVTSDGRLSSVHMTSYEREARLCAVGRFAYPQMMNDPHRLRRPEVREEGDLVPAGWPEATASVAEILAEHRGGGFLLVAGEAESRETRALYRAFAERVMGGRARFVPAAAGSMEDDVKAEILGNGIGAVWTAGDYLDAQCLDAVGYLVVADYLPSAAALRADAVLPVAILGEVSGTFRTADGCVRQLRTAASPPGDARTERAILGDLARALGAADFVSDTIAEVTSADTDEPPRSLTAAPRDRLRDLPARFRGHLIVDSVPSLSAMGHRPTCRPRPADDSQGFPVVDKSEVAPNFYSLTVKAPVVARHAKPGQFVIVMASEASERVPFTLIDWDPDQGTVDLVVQEVGRSSREVVALEPGDELSHVAGPLGLVPPIEKVGTVALGGGCFGLGAIYPLARAHKQAGNKVIGVIEAASRSMLYMEEKLGAVCDELLVATKDGSRGTKGGVQEVFVGLHENSHKPNLFVAIGCTFMMRMVAEATAPLGTPLQVALTPIMVDGTGMCGACRVSVACETRFACVDGPFFDGHAIDWDELFSRMAAYKRVEIEAMPQTAALRASTSGDPRHAESDLIRMGRS